MNIKELTGPRLKKALGLKKASKRWHNKNKSGGNFSISLITHDQGTFELTGAHDTTGTIRHLAVGEIWQPGWTICDSGNYQNFNFESVISNTNLMISK